MKCPYCGSTFAGNVQYCPNCKQPISRAKSTESQTSQADNPSRDEFRSGPNRLLFIIVSILCLIILCFAVYKLFFWASNYRIHRLYTRGEYTPTVNEITLDDGRIGHSIVFYGKDGNQIFLPEMQKSISISGGTARIALADSDWFEEDVTEIESANVCLSPVLIDEKGMRTQLPAIEMDIAVPESPLDIISPASDSLNIVTSRYVLAFQVVPGSTVHVNGENVTDIVDRNGLLSQNVNVYPVGDNVYTIVVQTPKHHATRREVVIHRQTFDINVEVDSSVSTISQTDTATIKGTIENGAYIVVETDYNENSLLIDQNTGEFAFIAQLSTFGDNTVRFRVKKEGKEDAVISLNVEYFPSPAVYSAKAWAMDYDQLRRLYEQWQGRVFKCNGTIIDTFESDGTPYLVMDVGTDGLEYQYVILENKSAVAKPSVGEYCTAYADVNGRVMYDNQYYPKLSARYIYFPE